MNLTSVFCPPTEHTINIENVIPSQQRIEGKRLRRNLLIGRCNCSDSPVNHYTHIPSGVGYRGIGLTFLFLVTSLLFSCQEKLPPAGKTLFTEIPASYSGVTFNNQLTEDTTFNILNYLYFFNGGGVGIADVNNDSLPDIYFTANMGEDKLYLNRGNFQFEEVAQKATILNTDGWSTGINMADINGDGLTDFYVCQVTDYLSFKETHNLLFINQGVGENGIPTFKEVAEEAGVAHKGFSTQSAFFDYDQDGDLDLYLLNHSVHTESSYTKAKKVRFTSDTKAGDKLYRNDTQNGVLKFTDVTQEAGIYNSSIGYGLGLAIADINADGWEDIYVGNDFHENDYLYLNNGDGTFSEKLTEAIGHTSRFSMGVDIADLNNDALPDILSLDMKPDREDILKTSAPEDAYDVYQFKLSYGYHHQLAKNAVQINQGNYDNKTPFFSETSEMSGLPATDWSWSVLAADFDLDGLQDIFISNGIYRRPNDMDYINYISENSVKNSLAVGVNEENLKVITKMPSVPIANYAFQQTPNNSSIPSFQNVSSEWGLDKKGFSNGAAYADLDNDGDLDVVINNLNETSSIYKNEAVEKKKGNWLKVRLKGEGLNKEGIGAKVTIEGADRIQTRTLQKTRGFQSSTESVLFFGLGEVDEKPRLVITWLDGATQHLKDVEVNQTITLDKKNATSLKSIDAPFHKSLNFHFQESETKISFEHKENQFLEFTGEQLIPHLLSTQGPCIAKGDINNDGREDFYVGGATGQIGKLFYQNEKGQFITSRTNGFKGDAIYEDNDAAFFDADGDGDQDLYVVSGGNEPSNPQNYIDRLYLNDGKGFFKLAEQAIPKIPMNGSCVEVADIDNDGDMDLFVGGLSIPGRYGFPMKSSIYLNDGKGKFLEATKQIAPELNSIGMVTDAAWLDLNNDKMLDLVVVGEWMPVTYFYNVPTRWRAQTLKNTEGLWQHLQTIDANNDGNLDLIAGNLGENSDLKASEEEPIKLYFDDFDGNSQPEQIISVYRNKGDGTRNIFPLAGRDALTKQMPSLKKKYFQYSELAGKTVEELFPNKTPNRMELQAVEVSSVLLLSDGKGKLEKKPLPRETQVSPIMASKVYDFNQDGNQDIMLGGNLYGVTPAVGRYDASYGQILLGDGEGNFNFIPNRNLNFWLKGEIRSLEIIGDKVLVGRNDAEMQVLEIEKGYFYLH